MIETKIINYINLNQNNVLLEIYKSRPKLFLFRAMSTLHRNNIESLFFFIFFKLIFFLQIFINTNLASNPNSTKNELIYTISNYMNFFQNSISTSDSSKYLKIFQLICYFSIFYFFLFFVLFYVTFTFYNFCHKKIYLNTLNQFLIKSLNFLNTAMIDYFYYPTLYFLLSSLNCGEDGKHMVIGSTCYTGQHLIIFTVLVVILIFYTGIFLFLTFFDVDVGGICEERNNSKINSKYEFYTIIFKISFAVFSFIVFDLKHGKIIYTIVYIIHLATFSIFQVIYISKYVLYFSPIIQNFLKISWMIILWSSLVNLLDLFVELKFIVVFHIFGWILMILILLIYKEYNFKKTLHNFKIFTTNSMKEIMFLTKLLNSYIENENTQKNRVEIASLSSSFKMIIESNEELTHVFQKFISDSHLKKVIKSRKHFETISLIYVLLNYYMKCETRTDITESRNIYKPNIHKNFDQEEVILHMCLFLMNRLRNYVYAIYLMSKIKFTKIRNELLKFIILENIKDRSIQSLQKIYNYETIKSIEIGSLILHNLYTQAMVHRIQTEVELQMSYFSFFNRDKGISDKTNLTENFVENHLAISEDFLDCGNKIIKIKKEIQELYPKLLEIYPATNESNQTFSTYEYFYNVYLEEIEQDDYLITKEHKNYMLQLDNFLNHKGEIYKSLFDDNSCLVIVDGYIEVGTIIYYTENFLKVFPLDTTKLSTKININDFVPNCIKNFHTEVVMNGIRFSNLSNVFGKSRIIFLRGLGFLTHMAKVYIRPIPNFEHGLIYIISLIKVNENNSSSTILIDSEFKLDCLTNPAILGNESNNLVSAMNMFDLLGHKNYKKQENVEYLEKKGNFKINEDFSKNSSSYTSINTYSLINSMNIMMLIPQILLYTRFSKQKGYFFEKSDAEYLGILYHFSQNNMKHDTRKSSKFYRSQKISQIHFLIEKILENIKENGHYIETETEPAELEAINHYKNLVNVLDDFSEGNSLIHFSLITKRFVNGLFKYHRIVVNRTMVSLNNDDIKFSKNSEKDKYFLDRISGLSKKEKLGRIQTGIKINFGNKKSILDLNKNQGNKKNIRDKKIFETNINSNENKEEKKIEFKSPKKSSRKPTQENFLQIHSSIGSFNQNSISLNNMDLLYYLNLAKKKLSENNNTTSVLRIKILVIIFFFSSIFLLLFSIFNSNAKFYEINKFLEENKFFNMTKIYLTSIYSTLRNFEDIKYGIYSDEFCVKSFQQECQNFNQNFLQTLIEDFSVESRKLLTFPTELKNLLNEEIQVKRGNSNKENLKITKVSLLNLIISSSLNLNSNFEEFQFSLNPKNFLNLIFEDVISFILKFTSDEIPFSGFDDFYLSSKFSYNSLFMLNNNLLLINFILLIILISLILYLNIILFQKEKKIVVQLLEFNHKPSFEVYLKNLIRIDLIFKGMNNLQKDESVKSEVDLNFSQLEEKDLQKNLELTIIEEFDELNSNENVQEKLPKAKNLKNSHTEKINFQDKKRKINSKKVREKLKKKKEKERKEKIGKIKKLSNFFYLNFMKLVLIVSFILLISLSFFLVLLVMTKTSVENSLTFYKTLEEIDSVYQYNFRNFLNVKKTFSEVIDEEIKIFDLNYELIKEYENFQNLNLINNFKNYSKSKLSQNFYTKFFQNKGNSNLTQYFSESFKNSELFSASENLKNFNQLLSSLINFNFNRNSINSEALSNLNTLYNLDMCLSLFSSTENETEKKICDNFKNTKIEGVQQTLSNLNLLYSKILEDFKNGYNSDTNFVKILSGDWGIYEIYVIFYFYKAYRYTHRMSEILVENNVKRLQDNSYFLFLAFVIVFVIFLVLIFWSVNKIDKNLKSFLNFLNIIPSKYLIEDVIFAKSIIKLKDEL